MALLVLILFSLFAFSSALPITNKVGINYGRKGNNLPTPYQSIELLKSMNIARVKLYDANPETLQLLSGTNIQVSVMIPNEQITSIASNQSLANQWVRENVFAHYPDTKIRYILVGNEVLSYDTDNDRLIWRDLVPAMTKIKKSLVAKNIKNIKIGTPLAMDMMETTFPPSNGRFRENIIREVMQPLLHFLNGTSSFFFLDVYPYNAWSTNANNMSLDYALLRNGSYTFTDPTSGLNYTNLLDQMLDSVLFAMSKLGYNDIPLAISETGWPHQGDIDQPGANIYNAATYNRNVVRKMTTQPPLGTPARPRQAIPTYIFSLFDENQKDGPGTERHWGLYYPDGRPVYEFDINANRPDSSYKTLPTPTNNGRFRGQIWCVVADGVSENELGSALAFACSQDADVCEALAPGNVCYEPVSVISHASYAFSSYWAKYRNTTGGSCYFDGLAVQTTTNPSYGSCIFPSVTI